MTRTMMKDCVMMKDGKMRHIMNGKATMMEKDINFPNRTKAMIDGNIKVKDGSAMMLINGDGIMTKAEMTPTPNKTGHERAGVNFYQ